MRAPKARKPQERTAITRELLLDAAEQVFVQHGYEKAQLEVIASAAGFSKGALYAHFKSKEELFLALAQAKAAAYQAKLRHALDRAQTREAKVAAFRSFYVNLVKDKTWALLILEVKLFFRRKPEVKERFRRAEEEMENSVEGALVELFGPAARAAGIALGGVLSALVLESDLEPDAVTERKLRIMLGTVFNALLGLHVPDTGPQNPERDQYA